MNAANMPMREFVLFFSAMCFFFHSQWSRVYQSSFCTLIDPRLPFLSKNDRFLESVLLFEFQVIFQNESAFEKVCMDGVVSIMLLHYRRTGENEKCVVGVCSLSATVSVGSPCRNDPWQNSKKQKTTPLVFSITHSKSCIKPGKAEA